MHDLIAGGERLGYKDAELKNYVSDQEKLQRAEREQQLDRKKRKNENINLIWIACTMN